MPQATCEQCERKLSPEETQDAEDLALLSNADHCIGCQFLAIKATLDACDSASPSRGYTVH